MGSTGQHNAERLEGGLAEAVRKALDDLGVEVLGKPDVFRSYILDFADADSREVRVLERCCDDKLTAPYAEFAAGKIDAREAAGRAEFYLVNEYVVSEETAKSVSQELAAGVIRWQRSVGGFVRPAPVVSDPYDMAPVVPNGSEQGAGPSYSDAPKDAVKVVPPAISNAGAASSVAPSSQGSGRIPARNAGGASSQVTPSSQGSLSASKNGGGAKGCLFTFGIMVAVAFWGFVLLIINNAFFASEATGTLIVIWLVSIPVAFALAFRFSQKKWGT